MMNDDVDDSSMDFLKFRKRCDSLRLAASNVAAMAGLHPYKDLVELAVNLVYQGSDGRRLLRHDADLLGISLMSKEEQLMEMLASKNASHETRQALNKALAVGRGTVQVSSIEQARKIKHKVIQTAKKDKNLTAQEVALLQEGTRSAVDTGYGTFHEDDALDQWQRMTGCEIRNRNAQLLTWPFMRTRNDDDDVDTVAPMGPATAVSADNKLGRQKRGNSSSSSSTTDGKRKATTEEQSSGHDDKKTKSAVSVIDLTTTTAASTSTDCEQSETTSDAVDDQNTPPPPCEDKDKKKEEQPPHEQQKPFFVIVGSVDGIRDEIVSKAPPSMASNKDGNTSTSNDENCMNNDRVDDDFDDDGWSVKEIIVEVKHRMRQIYKVPPLYEQIQATIYCFMYNCKDADLVQVLRRTTEGKHGSSDKENSKQRKITATTAALNAKKKDDNQLEEQTTEESNRVESLCTTSEDKGTSDKAGTQQSSSFVDETKEEQLPQQPDTKSPPPCHDRDTNDYSVSLPPCDGPVEDQSKKTRVLEEEADTKESGESSSAVGDEKQQALNASSANPCTGSAPETNGKTSDASSTPPIAVNDQKKRAARGSRSSSTPRSVPSVTSITASRVSLDDPVWQHGRHWEQVILPRLCSFVQAVYSIRGNDDKRYRLLMAAVTTAASASSEQDEGGGSLSSSSKILSSTNKDGWKILFDECPWLLRDCNDTAYHRSFM